MDRITKSLLEEFTKENDFVDLPEEKRFEHFATFLTVSKHYSETFDTTEVVTGYGNDTGIDAVAVVVNGALVTDVEEIEEYAQANGYIDATFVFVQAERSEGFDTAKIGQFGFGVVDFFNDAPSLPRNERIKSSAEIMASIYKRSSRFKRGNPACRLYYVTSGKWQSDPNLEARRTGVIQDLTKLGIFREVEFTPVGADSNDLLSGASPGVSRLVRQPARSASPPSLAGSGGSNRPSCPACICW